MERYIEFLKNKNLNILDKVTLIGRFVKDLGLRYDRESRTAVAEEV